MTSVGVIFMFEKKPMHKNFSFSRAGADQSAKPTALVGSTDSLSAEAQSATLTPSSRLSRPTALVGLADSPVANPANLHEKLSNQPNRTSTDVGPIYMIGGLPCWHIYVILVLKLTRVFGEVLSNMCRIMMSSIGEPLRTC
jgi:hypothetical protein